MKVHELKTQFFDEIYWFKKTADLRVNDRGFHTGDVIHYREYNPQLSDSWEGYAQYNNKGGSFPMQGRECFAKITHMVSAEHPCVESDGALKEGYVILSIKVQKLVDA
jgi:hypothetical protein